jgi:hypothetical protein
VEFGNAEPGTIVEAERCPACGVYVKAKQLGCNEEGFCMIPTALPDQISRGLIYLLWLSAP